MNSKGKQQPKILRPLSTKVAIPLLGQVTANFWAAGLPAIVLTHRGFVRKEDGVLSGFGFPTLVLYASDP